MREQMLDALCRLLAPGQPIESDARPHGGLCPLHIAL
jgi:hypothetical protein